MSNYRNVIPLAGLIEMGVVSEGVLEDKLGNQVTLHRDGTISLTPDGDKFSINEAAKRHNLAVNDINKRVNGWLYWYVPLNTKRVKLQELRSWIHNNIVVRSADEILNSLE